MRPNGKLGAAGISVASARPDIAAETAPMIGGCSTSLIVPPGSSSIAMLHCDKNKRYDPWFTDLEGFERDDEFRQRHLP
jgi:hypothetical protein